MTCYTTPKKKRQGEDTSRHITQTASIINNNNNDNNNNKSFNFHFHKNDVT